MEMPRNFRIQFVKRLIPGVQEIGFLRVHSASDPMMMERHDGLFELLYLMTGEKRLNVSGEDYLMHGGDLLVIHPGEPHGNFVDAQNRSNMMYVFLVSPDAMPGFLNLTDSQRQTLTQRLMNLRLVRADKGLRHIMNRFAECAERDDPQDDFYEARLSAYMVLLLDEISKCPMESGGRSVDILRAIQYIENNPSEMFSIQQLAKEVGLSEARFKQKFKQQTGIPPAEYVVRRHVSMAQEQLLSSQDSITKIAMRLGFSSSQHLCRLFRHYVGLSPSDYRREHGKKAVHME